MNAAALNVIALNVIAQLVRDRPADAAVYVEGRSGRAVTGADLAAAVAHWRPRVAHLGGAPVVAMATADPLEFATTYLGLLAAGARVAPLDPGAPAAAMRQDIVELGATAVVVDGDLAPVAGGGHGAGDGGVLLRSSGSTGPRKLIHLSVPQLVHVGAAVARAHVLSPEDVGYSPLPLFHVNAQVVGLLSTLVAGSTLVLDRRFSRRRFWPTVAKQQVTWLNAVPAILAILEHDGD
ncbi:MAG: AMP-binding protein, partial [Mycobacteriaceae bacterium]